MLSSSPVVCMSAAQRAGSSAFDSMSPAPAVNVAAAKNTATSPKLVTRRCDLNGRRACFGSATTFATAAGFGVHALSSSDHSSQPRRGSTAR